MHQQNGHDSGYAQASITRFIPKSIHRAFELKQWRERPSDPISGRSRLLSRRIDVAASVERKWRVVDLDIGKSATRCLADSELVNYVAHGRSGRSITRISL
jgi:hypothetical protein